MNQSALLAPRYGNGISKWTWSPADSLSCSDCPDPVFYSSSSASYIISVSDRNGCSNSDTVNVTVFCDGANVTMPNAFTPNNDGSNDVFYVRGTGFTVRSFSIYNRLGNEVFRREHFLPGDMQYGWNGFVNGTELNDAAGFVYMLEVDCLNSKGETILLKGTVLLMK